MSLWTDLCTTFQPRAPCMTNSGANNARPRHCIRCRTADGKRGCFNGRYRNQRLAFSNTLVTREDRILVPEHLRNTILTRIHNASHPGIKRTLHLLKRQFTWDGIHRDTLAFCKACNVCQREKSKNKTDEPLKPIRAASKPRQMIAYDVATLPWGNGQFRYFLIMTDLFSKCGWRSPPCPIKLPAPFLLH